MYKKIKIENFRGISQLQFKDLKQFNLIVGKNNSCKTTVLESIFLLTGPTNPDIPIRINSFRGFHLINDYSWSLIFYKLDIQLSSKLYGEVINPKEKRDLTIRPLKETAILKPQDPRKHNGHIVVNSSHTAPVDRVNGLSFEYSIKKGNSKETLKFHSDIRRNGKDLQKNLPNNYKNSLNGIFIYPNYGFGDNTRRFNDIQIKKQEKRILRILQKIEPGIKDLSVGSDDILYCDVGFNELVPVNIVGEGINRLLSIVLAIYEASNGVVLIDEVENGFHYSALEFLWEAIFESAREFNVQVFATTHSFENIKSYSSAYEKLGNKKDNMRLYRLEKEEERLELISIDHEMLKITLENGLEIR
ncbi:MAG: AAA family ATPase [Candidatus Aminicenantes bacterium]|nr:MAG: AAA family ATPase [Candidatus Aminicenantes bacterium]